MYNAVIPIRLESTRCPRKNIRPLAGRPLCVWILETLAAVDGIERILVDTDSLVVVETITSYCRAAPRVEIHWRAQSLRGAGIVADQLLAGVLAEHQGDYWIQTHATSPLLTAATIRQALAEFERDLVDGIGGSLATVSERRGRFYRAARQPTASRGATWTEPSAYEPLNHDPWRLAQTQELEPLWEDNSALYCFTRQSFAETRSRIGRNVRLYPIDPVEATDIDTEHDFFVADVLARLQRPAYQLRSG